MRVFFLLILLSACRPAHELTLPARQAGAVTGSELYRQAAGMKWDEREPIIEKEILSGNLPAFLRKFVRINTSIIDSGKTIKAYYFVSPDYLSVGSNDDWARVPLTPMTAQRIADSLQCFLPTRKMVDDIYKQATVKLEPVPMFAFRDSAITFWHHHLIIEGQRKGRKGLIAGIKKDVLMSKRPDRVTIYGWHKLDGKSIQPLYSGHVNWYVDYSHGIRLVYKRINVRGRWMNYEDVLNHPVYKKLLSDE
ncbi:MAG TPA: hypothetical protein VEB42_10945 [Chitinophagaceae bacterium]|nr:hypothetical protein [Chitinophagaceae bacterium]